MSSHSYQPSQQFKPPRMIPKLDIPKVKQNSKTIDHIQKEPNLLEHNLQFQREKLNQKLNVAPAQPI